MERALDDAREKVEVSIPKRRGEIAFSVLDIHKALGEPIPPNLGNISDYLSEPQRDRLEQRQKVTDAGKRDKIRENKDRAIDGFREIQAYLKRAEEIFC